MSGTDRAARQTADDILARLRRLHPKVIDLSLDRILHLLAKLGDPHLKLPPVLHIAGTNGKGSVVATARAMAEAAGHRVHTYTSPHLVRFNERIRLAGHLIDDGTLEALLLEVEDANGDDAITFFEITTAAAFLAFARTPADLVILEVGLGGRLDATNVIERPAGVAITPVAHDHQSFLGEDLPQIAAEKAGIIKRGTPVVCGPQLGIVEQVIRARTQAEGGSLFAFGRQWRAGLRTGGRGEARLVYKDGHGTLDLPAPVLVGPHQAANAGTAIALLRHQMALPIPDAAIRAGLGWVRWPARLQKLDSGPLRERLGPNAELWLDGGHNAAAARALKEALIRLAGEARPVHLVVGMGGNRDAHAFLQPFFGLAETIYGVQISGIDEPMPAARIATAATDIGIRGTMASSVAAALDAVASSAKGEAPLVLITGSLYLAGEVLAINGPRPE